MPYASSFCNPIIQTSPLHHGKKKQLCPTSTRPRINHYPRITKSTSQPKYTNSSSRSAIGPSVQTNHDKHLRQRDRPQYQGWHQNLRNRSCTASYKIFRKCPRLGLLHQQPPYPSQMVLMGQNHWGNQNWIRINGCIPQPIRRLRKDWCKYIGEYVQQEE